MADSQNHLDKFLSLVELLSYRGQNQPAKRAYTFLQNGDKEEVNMNYQQLDQEARALASHLHSLGATGEPALLLYPPGLEFIAAFFGCLYAKFVAVPAYPPKRNQKLSRLREIVTDAQANVVLTTSSLLAKLVSQWAENPELPTMHWLSTDDIDSNLSSNWQEPRLEKDTLAFLQ